MPTLEGSLVAPEGARFALVCSRFNDAITQRLLDGALDALARHGADAEQVDVAWCPGAFEVPLVAKTMAESGRYDAVVALGAVIRGAT
ncbi:MAG: 6,7-dimethyl-8-ribityllumazine synthase, partial [Rubricoccaceae bacterium]|nr:6,7-dimethyl-8-ribityllumazine synthase [Rubricoccaceae bacterium]